LLHPHPQFGGDRFHPFVEGLFGRLPQGGVSAVRFDFGSADADVARDEVMEVIDRTAPRVGLAVVVVGYSFGAGVAVGVDDDRVVGWYLLAPPASMLVDAIVGADSRPKVIAVPANDQFSPPEVVRRMVAAWTATTVVDVAGTDHFLGSAVGRVVNEAFESITTTLLP